MREKSVLPWVRIFLGVVALIVLTTITIIRLTPGHSRPATLPPPEPAFTLPGATSGPQVPVTVLSSPVGETGDPREASEGRAAGSGPTTHTRPAGVVTPPRTAAPIRTTPQPPPAVTGSYRVLSSFSDTFTGEVLLRNGTGSPQDWVLTLTYPGELRASWLESLPQPTLTRRGTTYTWRSSVPLAAGSTGQMRFQFDLVGGSDRPSSCRVGGAACS